jgi:uncharacterized delta-60 repeat protein
VNQVGTYRLVGQSALYDSETVTLQTNFTSFSKISGVSDVINASAIQSDGKILIGGNFKTYDSTVVGYLARLNSDGTLDSSFNSGGTGFNNVVSAILALSNGKILVCGTFSSFNSASGTTTIGGIARLNSDGTLDTSFNAGGTGFNSGVSAYRIALQSTNKIIVIGSGFTSYNDSNGTTSITTSIARINTDGTLDTTFNPAGTGFTGGTSAIAIQSDDKIIVGGYFSAYNGVSCNFLIRLTANGAIDGTFSNGLPGNGVQSIWRPDKIQSSKRFLNHG